MVPTMAIDDYLRSEHGSSAKDTVGLKKIPPESFSLSESNVSRRFVLVCKFGLLC
jgi:hypothetical protein